MATVTVTTYGLGGYDPDKADGNVVEVVEVDVPAEADPDADLAAAIEAASTLAELKAALLGSAPDARARAAGKRP